MSADVFPIKHPDHKLDYTVDLSAKVGADAVKPDVRCVSKNAADLTITNPVISQGKVSCFIAGGRNGQNYDIYFGATFADDTRNHGETCKLPVKVH
jgi:hypothetical protein